MFTNSPTGPRVSPPSPAPPPDPWSRRPARPRSPPPRFRYSWMSVTIFVLLLASIGIRAWRDLSHPEGWSYFQDRSSSSLSFMVLDHIQFDGATRRVLAVSGPIRSAAASWLRQKLDEARLESGDVLLLSSPGGNLDQSLIMGEEIRRRGLASAVGVMDGHGHIAPSDCASACVFIYSGGTKRYGIAGSRLGVHRFVSTGPDDDPVAETQRTTGQILGYVSRMGIEATMVEAMSKTRAIRWLDDREALAMNLITTPLTPRREGSSD
ncbi:MAG: hypothetical protein FWD68_06030 [Alphaproteobacteria bacterium]|nr:hypothetical protein [Alphaproteobacteria bacterium]